MKNQNLAPPWPYESWSQKTLSMIEGMTLQREMALALRRDRQEEASRRAATAMHGRSCNLLAGKAGVRSDER